MRTQQKNVLKHGLIGLAFGGVSMLALTGTAAADYNDALRAYAAQNYSDAEDLWRRYAAAGDVKSKHTLGDLYSHEKIFELTAVNGTLMSPADTGSIGPDNIEALAWYILSANHDFASYNQSPSFAERHAQIESRRRMHELMAIMSNGETKKAQKRVINMLSSGSDTDLYRLGKMYQTGSGVVKDNVESLKFYLLSSGRNTFSNERALQQIDLVKAKMTKKEIKRATEKAEEWQPPEPQGKAALTPAEEKKKDELSRLKLLSSSAALDKIEPNFQNNQHLIQSALAALGMRPGKIDGKEGPATRAAIRRFQYSLVENDKKMSDEDKQNTLTGKLTVLQKVKLVEIAAKRNHPRSLYVYGIMNAQGIGVPVNGERSVENLKKSANYGSALAHNALGRYYRDGILGEKPIEPNRGKASYHFGQAVALGHEASRSELIKLDYEFAPAVND